MKLLNRKHFNSSTSSFESAFFIFQEKIFAFSEELSVSVTVQGLEFVRGAFDTTVFYFRGSEFKSMAGDRLFLRCFFLTSSVPTD